MAFVSFNQKELAKILGVCSNVSPKRSEIDLFTMTKLMIDKEGLVTFLAISSSVYYAVSKKSIKPDVAGDISFLVNTDLFNSAVNLIGDDVVGLDIDLDKTSLTITGAKSKHTLRINLQNVEDFNIPAENDEEKEYEVEVNKEEFLEANRVAATSVGNPRVVSQPEFLSVCLHIEPSKSDEIVMVSTDRFRMSQTNLGVALNKIKEGEVVENYLVDPKNLSLLSLCEIEDDKIKLKFEKNFLWVYFDDAKIAYRYREGKFPDWKKILPSSFSCSFKLNVAELLGALKQVYFSARTNAINKTVSIEVKPKSNEIVFVAKTEDGNSSESTLELTEYEGVEEDWNQSFNADYLIDYVSTLGTELVLWEANPGKPSVLSPNEAKEKQLCLISGLR